MEREQLVSAGVGVERLRASSGGVGQRPLCRGQFYEGGGRRGRKNFKKGREQLVCAGVGDERHRGGAGGSAANSIAKWDGSSWSALGSGLNGYAQALAVSGSDLYAGGNFTTAGGIAAKNIAKWDGSSWSALGLGMNDTVGALAVSGS